MKRDKHLFSPNYLFLIPLCLSLFIMPVKAETDIWYPDPDSYQAYNYFIAHGYSDLVLSSTDNVTYNVNLDNYGSNNGTIKGTDTTTGTDKTTGTFNSNGSSTLGAKYMTCTTNNAVSGTQTYTCRFSNTQTGSSNSQSINIGFNSNLSTSVSESTSVNETINQSINTDITGSITGGMKSYQYIKLPWLKGTYTHPTAYDDNDSISLFTGDRVSFSLIYYCTANSLYSYDKYMKYSWDNFNDYVTVSTEVNPIGNMFLYKWTFRLKSGKSSARFTIDFKGLTDQDILPIYYGYTDRCPDDIAIPLGMRKSVAQLMDKGNDYTQNNVNNFDSAKYQLDNKITEFDNFESNSVTDMENNLNNIDVTSDLIINNQFISSAAWVKTQFDRITTSTPIGSVLTFSLILGLCMIFLGKIR